jgi:hypothetical protein
MATVAVGIIPQKLVHVECFPSIACTLKLLHLSLSVIVSQSSDSSTARAHKLDQRGSFLLQMKERWFLFEESCLSRRLLLVVANGLGISVENCC